jgi:two-component system, sensor histidine kinase and response regulator
MAPCHTAPVTGSSDIADFQLALDAMRDGVALWSADGRLLVTNAAASTLMNIPPGIVRPGVERLEVMTFLARRGDYGPTDDPAALARKLSAGFGAGEVASLTRKLPDGRYVRADGRRLPDGRSLVTYREVDGPAEMNT